MAARQLVTQAHRNSNKVISIPPLCIPDIFVYIDTTPAYCNIGRSFDNKSLVEGASVLLTQAHDSHQWIK